MKLKPSSIRGPAAVSAALILVGCSGTSAGPSPDGAEPVTLRMGTLWCCDEYIPAAIDFAEHVEHLSDGNVTVDLIHGVGDFEPDAEQQVVRSVIDGDMDIALAGTRVFDTLGTSSFQALHAPMLVDSYPLQAAIIDSDIPDQMLAGLDELGLAGLALLAGGLRKPIAVAGPMLAPEDYAGAAFNSNRSAAQADAITALGATPDDSVSTHREAGLLSGELAGTEQSLLFYAGTNMHSVAGYVTANVTLWPETTVLIANPDRLAELSNVQVGWVHDAAAAAASRSAEIHDVDADLVAGLCDSGARLVEASDAALTALADAFAPAYEQLERDVQTRELITRIVELKQDVTTEPLPIPDGCAGDTPADVAAPSPDEADSIPLGRYVGLVTREGALAAGVPAEIVDDAPSDLTVTLQIDDSSWVLFNRFEGQADQVFDRGTYAYDDGSLVLTAERGCPGCAYVIDWTLDEGALTLTLLDADDGDADIDDAERAIEAIHYNGVFENID